MPEWGDDGVVAYLTVGVTVQSTVKAPTELPEKLALDLFVADPSMLKVAKANLPTATTLFFMVNDERGWRLTSPVSYFRDVEGVEPAVGAEEPWQLELKGTSFQSLTLEADAIAQSSE